MPYTLVQRFVSLGLLMAGVGLAPGAFAQRLPRLRQGMNYPEAREQLIARGWQPVVNPVMLEVTNTTPIVAYLISQGFSELIGCQPFGVDVCAFQFRNRHGHILEIATVHLGVTPGGTITSWVVRRNTP
ncbi:hypothetical protein BRW62_11850 [Parathermosynechococcus lividus PCC 6715]|uniref:Uncharacterized protein n=1 Tax=Parathermosynechococcus lividus PCC 6715 TaxID=1917166 RepID=A0A2D2Q4Y9_PARLV|nr:hypothetical protein [Thermostichus lividus]ATS19307.1 hypothetical protein BRW62_11850 [Thermostichus lividus PCC 6715]